MPLNGPASVTGGLGCIAAMSGPLRVFADHEHRVAGVTVRRDGQVGRRGRSLEDAGRKVETRVVAGAVVAPRPVASHVRGGADLLLEGRGAAQVGADAFD